MRVHFVPAQPETPQHLKSQRDGLFEAVAVAQAADLHGGGIGECQRMIVAGFDCAVEPVGLVQLAQCVKRCVQFDFEMGHQRRIDRITSRDHGDRLSQPAGDGTVAGRLASLGCGGLEQLGDLAALLRIPDGADGGQVLFGGLQLKCGVGQETACQH